MQTNRTDAAKTMQLAAQSLQRCYSTNVTYAGCTVNGNVVNDGSTMVTPNLFYNITFGIPDPQIYTLTAVAVQAPQTTDDPCAQVTLSSTGSRPSKTSIPAPPRRPAGARTDSVAAQLRANAQH